MANVAPLNTSFMVIAMVGFLISTLYIPQKLGTTWALSFGIVFIMMFVSSLISMVGGTPDEQLYPLPKKVR